MTRLTSQELDAIRKRAEAATVGPWIRSYQDVKTTSVLDRKYNEPEIIAEVIYAEEVDAEFIANARTDIPKLLAEIERLNNKITYFYSEMSRNDGEEIR